METTTLILGVLFGSVGIGYFVYGRKQQSLVAIVSGLGLFGVTYFFDGVWPTVVAGVVLMALPFVIKL